MRSTVTRLPLLLLVAAVVSACASSEQPTPLPCAFSVTASPAAFGPAGGTGSATITTAAGCSWTARAESGWLTITAGASGSGGGVVTFTVAANTEPAARGGSLTIAGQSLSIQQEAAAIVCAFSISPLSASMGKDGGNGSVAVGTSASCGWTAVSEADLWLVVIDGRSGTGAGTVTYGVARNNQVSARTGTIRIAGEAFRMTQSGDTGACTYSVAPVELSACMGSRELASEIVTQGGCPWTAEAGASWITMTAGASGSGPGTVRFSVSDNWDAPRNAVVMVRWPTPTAGQNVRIAQAGCYYSVTRDSFTIGATGANEAFEVVTMSEPYTCGGPLQNACVWTAISDATWITVTSGMPRSGDDRVSFSVAPNPGTAPRSGTIRVRDKVVRISQAGS